MANVIDRYVGARLAQIQAEREVSDDAVCIAMRVSHADLNRFLCGEQRITPQQLFALFQATGITATDLLPDGQTALALTSARH